jgi:NADH:ubiquinone oxidoreductase subunit 3 (subunit A)
VEAWTSTLGFLLVSIVVTLGLVAGSAILGVRSRRPAALRDRTYECGEEPEGLAWVRFHPRYYVVALLFVLFDVEAVFLFPWALMIRELGSLAILEMVLFVAVLMLGWAYAVRKGALKWQ